MLKNQDKDKTFLNLFHFLLLFTINCELFVERSEAIVAACWMLLAKQYLFGFLA